MQILERPVSREELKAIAQNTFGEMAKCVADIRRGLLAIDADLHADLEALLLQNGSAQEDLWGFNLWVEEEGEDFIEFDSLINIRSWQNNPSRDILNPEVRDSIKAIVAKQIIGYCNMRLWKTDAGRNSLFLSRWLISAARPAESIVHWKREKPLVLKVRSHVFRN